MNTAHTFRRPPRRIVVRLPVLLLLSLPVTTTAQLGSYTLDDWMTISEVTSYAWAPDGQSFVYSSNASPSGALDLYRVPADGGVPERLGRDDPGVRPEAKDQFVLSPDGRTIYFTAARYFSAYHNIYRMPAAGGPSERLTFHDGMIQTSPDVSPDGKTLAFFARTGRGARVFAIELDEVRAWPMEKAPGGGEQIYPRWSASGRLAWLDGGELFVLGPGETEPVPLSGSGLVGGTTDYAWSPSGDRIALVNGNSGYRQIGVVDVETGRLTPVTYAERDHEDVAWSPDGSRLAFTRSDASGMSNDVVVVRSDGTGQVRVLTSGKGQREQPRFSPDGRSIAWIGSTSTRTADIWIMDLETDEVRQVTRSMGRIDPADLSDATEISWRGADNLKIPGMLWLPPGFDPGKTYPVLVRLHGHPSQWNHGFRLMTQYFVSKGFVALAPNPRGSVGFGQGFHDLHIADYGGEEFNDVMQVLPYLAQLGYIDMTKKATWGGSGGGYMSLVIATRAPAAFEAQVIRAPVTDWRILVNDRHDARGRAWTARRTPRRSRADIGGAYADIPYEYEARSPVNFASAVETPQLLFHGLRDTNVLPRQSMLWVEALEEAGKEELIEFVSYPDEDHSLRRYRATVRDRIERMTAFFAEHLDLPDLAAGNKSGTNDR